MVTLTGQQVYGFRAGDSWLNIKRAKLNLDRCLKELLELRFCRLVERKA